MAGELVAVRCVQAEEPLGISRVNVHVKDETDWYQVELQNGSVHNSARDEGFTEISVFNEGELIRGFTIEPALDLGITQDSDSKAERARVRATKGKIGSMAVKAVRAALAVEEILDL